MELGDKLRTIRKSKGLTLQKVADAAGLSKAFVSQLECGTANPSMATLKRIADALGTQVPSLFEDSMAPPEATGAPTSDSGNEVRVVRRDRRKRLVWPGSSATTYLLTPDLQHKLEVILSVMGPGHSTGDEHYHHQGEEFGFVLEGRYEVTVGDQVFVLEEGDSIYYPSHLPHRMRVLSDGPAQTLWVITPPSY